MRLSEIRQESSFSEEKEAKRLLFTGFGVCSAAIESKVFCIFSSEKKTFLPSGEFKL